MLRIIYSDKKCIFTELIEKVNSVSTHKRDLHFFAIEMCKFKKRFGLAQNKQNRYELRNNVDFTLPLVKSVHEGLEGLSYLGPKIWQILLVEIKQIKFLLEFKAKIKYRNPQCCPCRLYKVYLRHVGFI